MTFKARMTNFVLCSLHQQKPKHHHDDDDAQQCQDRIAHWFGIVVPGAPPESTFAVGRDRNLVIGHGRRPILKEPS
jgi:hypothetical protein